jgi:hypothetical protein
LAASINLSNSRAFVTLSLTEAIMLLSTGKEGNSSAKKLSQEEIFELFNDEGIKDL